MNKDNNLKITVFIILYSIVFILLVGIRISAMRSERQKELRLNAIETETRQVKTDYAALMEKYNTLLADYQALEEQISTENDLIEQTSEVSVITMFEDAIVQAVDIPLIEETTIEETTDPIEVVAETENIILNTSTAPATYSYSYGQHINYVAFGNSITSHGINEYWWNNIGMGATTIDKDYVHQVLAGLQSLTGSASLTCYNYCTWELQANDRAETYCLIDYYLDTQPDIISIQLSENIIDMRHYESDWEELIRYVQNKCPNAQILIIDDFWYGGDKSNLKKQAAENCGVQFVDLSGIRGKSEYQCGMGTTVYDADGNPHTVNHEGVAAHPGDAGMTYIANQILQYIH